MPYGVRITRNSNTSQQTTTQDRMNLCRRVMTCVFTYYCTLVVLQFFIVKLLTFDIVSETSLALVLYSLTWSLILKRSECRMNRHFSFLCLNKIFFFFSLKQILFSELYNIRTSIIMYEARRFLWKVKTEVYTHCTIKTWEKFALFRFFTHLKTPSGLIKCVDERI